MRRTHFILTFFIGGLAFAAGMLYIAIDHNPQGQFIDNVSGAINWAEGIRLGGVWFIIGGIVVSFWYVFIIYFSRLIKMHREWRAKRGW